MVSAPRDARSERDDLRLVFTVEGPIGWMLELVQEHEKRVVRRVDEREMATVGFGTSHDWLPSPDCLGGDASQARRCV